MSVDPDLVGMSKAFNRSRADLAKHRDHPHRDAVCLCGWTGAFADSWKLAALVETFGGSSGVGYQIGRSYHLFSVRDVLAWMCFFVIFVVLLERLVLVNAERRLLRLASTWRRTASTWRPTSPANRWEPGHDRDPPRTRWRTRRPRDPRHRHRPAPGSRATARVHPTASASRTHAAHPHPASCRCRARSRRLADHRLGPRARHRARSPSSDCRSCSSPRRPPPRSRGSRRWRNGLARSPGVLTVGIGLEQALVATLRSTPAPISRRGQRLVARLRARWDTETALRAFADELDDATGDLIAANLILGARRRGAGLASVLEGLAESVAADVRARRQVEADRAKPRSTARWVTLISASVLVVLALSGTYVEPYRSPIGQVILVVLLSAYVAHAGLDAADGRTASRCPGSWRPAQSAEVDAMITGLQLAILSGGLVGLGAVLLVARLLPVEPDLADALERVSSTRISRRDGRRLRSVQQGAARPLGPARPACRSVGSYADSRARPAADLGRAVLRREADVRRTRPADPAGARRCSSTPSGWASRSRSRPSPRSDWPRSCSSSRTTTRSTTPGRPGSSSPARSAPTSTSSRWSATTASA